MICAECGRPAVSDPCPHCGRGVCSGKCAIEHLKQHWSDESVTTIESAARVALAGGDKDDVRYYIESRVNGGGTN